MRVFNCLVMMLCLGVLVLSLPVIAKADGWNRETLMTFDKPVEVPGMVLNPGTYEFKLADLAADRNVVQIFNADGTRLYKNVLAIPAYRVEPSDRTIVTFEERAEGAPPAIATWFYPGNNSGEEFIYPKTNPAGVTANATPITAAPPAALGQTNEAPLPASIAQQTAPTGQVQAAASPVTNKQPVQMAQAATQPKPAVSSAAPAVDAQHKATKRLPKTASPLPILFVLGLLSLGGSAVLHVFSKQPV